MIASLTFEIFTRNVKIKCTFHVENEFQTLWFRHLLVHYISLSAFSTLFLLHSLTQSLNVPPPFSLSLFSWKFPYLITLIIYPGTIFFFFILLYSLFYIPLHLLIFGIGFYVFIGINFILLINPFPFSKPNFPHFSSS